MSSMLKQENRCLNFFKGIACVLIVMLHTNISADSGLFMYVASFINCLSRIAVPLFFMISGFYLYSTDREKIQKKLPSKIKHILIICLVSVLLYTIYIILNEYILEGKSILEFFKAFTFKDLYQFLIFNDIPVPLSFGLHLWFVFTLLYCYLIMLLVNKYNLYKFAYIYMIIGFVILFILQYIKSFYRLENDCYYRNFFFDGFPCFMLGNFIAKHKEYILNSKKLIFSKKFCFIMIFAGIILSVLERLIITIIYKLLNINGIGHEVYFGSLISAVSIIIYSMRAPEKYFFKPIEYLGKYYSLDVYIIHNIIKGLFGNIFSYSANITYQIFRMLFTIIVSILVSILFRFTLNKIKSKKSPKTA